jgi:hypothetical protein
MTVVMMEIRHNEAAARPLFGGDLFSREALQGYVRIRWPANTAKHAAREWQLTLDEAKGLVAGRASQATLDKIWKHRNGGWAVALPVIGAVIGHGVDDFLQNERRTHVELARRSGALVRDLRSFDPVRPGGAVELASPAHRERRAVGR